MNPLASSISIMAGAGVFPMFDVSQYNDYSWSAYTPTLSGQVFDITTYGADPTGYIDSTAAINVAIDQARIWSLANGNQHTTIYGPEGTYRVMPTGTSDNPGYAFTVVFGNVTFEGDGAGITNFTFRAQGNRDPNSAFVYKRGGLFNVTGLVGFTGNVSFRGFRACGNADVTTGPFNDWYGGGSYTGWDITHKGIGCFGGLGLGNIRVTRCEFDHWRGEALYAGGGDELGVFIVDECVVRRVNASAISMGGEVSIINSRVYDCVSCTECFFFSGQTFRVTDSHFFPNKNLTGDRRIGSYGVITHGFPTATCAITGNMFGDASTGAIFLSESTSNLLVDNNEFLDTRAIYAIYIQQYEELEEFMNQFNYWRFTNNTIRVSSKNIDTAISTNVRTGYDWDFSNNTVVNQNGFSVARFLTHFSPDKTSEERASLIPDGAYTTTGNTLAGTISGYPPIEIEPVISVIPAGGPAIVGASLFCTRGTWLTDEGWLAMPNLDYSYQWKRNGTPIGGALSSVYVVDIADSGASITSEVTANNGIGDKVQISNSLAIP